MKNNKLKNIKLVGLAVFVSSIVIIFCVIFGIKICDNLKEYKTIDGIVDEVLNSTGDIMVYIGGKDCEKCSMQSYQMRLFISEFNLSYYYISLDSISNANAKKVLTKLGLDSSTEIPTIAIYKEGNISVSQSGLVGTKNLYNLLKNNGLINEGDLKLNYLTITNYVEKIEEKSVVLALGSMKSEDSIFFEEYLWEIADKYDININFLYASNLSQLEGDLFESKLLNFNNYDLKIPSLMIIDNGYIRDALVDLYSVDDYVVFLQENGIIR